ncbi:MAG: hypothetical protein KatS3mg032_0176 [Cyclobacteriaceae bacterium]|nr:MAG: hypothetical protein KatS3mg032_0176 [Cyclobacteriaceae bacterium]
MVARVVLCLACLNAANAEGYMPDTLFAHCQVAVSENPNAPEALPEHLLPLLNNILFIIKTLTIGFSMRIFEEPCAAILLPPHGAYSSAGVFYRAVNNFNLLL